MIIKNKRTSGKLNIDYGMKDYYNYFKKEYPELNIDRSKFNDVISDVNQGLINLIIEDGIEYVIPNFGSTISIKKTKNLPRIKNGKLYNPSPVDWVATNKLWSEDDEAREKKLLVRYTNFHTSKYVFRIYFKKYLHPFLNKKLFSFKPNRTFQRLLGKRIKDETKERYDAFLLYYTKDDK